MVNFLCSSIGKKLIMSLSGLFLVIFLTLHAGLNACAIISKELYDMVCVFMDTNPLVQIMVPVLAAGFVVHILYALWLGASNLNARPREMKYAVANKTKATSWASKNMLVLGFIVLGALAIHLFHFWSKMQLQHFIGGEGENAYELIVKLFSCPCWSIFYVAWFAAIYYHVSHGFWSAFQTIGLSNSNWIPRLQIIARIYGGVLFLIYVALPILVMCGCVTCDVACDGGECVIEAVEEVAPAL